MTLDQSQRHCCRHSDHDDVSQRILRPSGRTPKYDESEQIHCEECTRTLCTTGVVEGWSRRARKKSKHCHSWR